MSHLYGATDTGNDHLHANNGQNQPHQPRNDAEAIVPELAHMMGRPVRYGGEFRGFEERAEYMARIAADALADIAVGEDATFNRYIKRVPHGVVFVVAPWNGLR